MTVHEQLTGKLVDYACQALASTSNTTKHLPTKQSAGSTSQETKYYFAKYLSALYSWVLVYVAAKMATVCSQTSISKLLCQTDSSVHASIATKCLVYEVNLVHIAILVL